MATLTATLTGDMSDIFDTDFADAKVRIRANTDYVVDPTNNKIRITLGSPWLPVAADGTFSFIRLIASADTVVPGTLQYYVDIKILGKDTSTLGPYVLAAGSQDITDLIAVQAVPFNSATPISVDPDVLGAAEAYTDASIDAHDAATNPHPQYARVQSVSGASITLPLIFARVGDPFPPVTQGAILIYGGS